ncbi:MAG: 1-acyl-sn-glycerol-3-phosphate acyltransferase, partial [Gammaproteobacteria bacterium]
MKAPGKIMLAIRSAIFFLGMVVTVVLYTPIAIAAWPMHHARRYVVIGGWARFIVWWLKVTCNLTHRVSGMDDLPDSPHVMLSKHQSAWETIVFQTIFPSQAWVLKKELLKVPFFGWGLAASHPIAIDRSRGIKALDGIVKQGIVSLKEGRSVLV